MENVNELIEKSTDLLRSRRFEHVEFMNPYYPVWILYVGSESQKHHQSIYENLSNSWGVGARDILFLSSRKSAKGELEFGTTQQDGKEIILSIEDIQGKLWELLSSEITFINTASIALYLIFDTSDVQTVDAFEEAYLTINEIKKTFDTPFLSMLLILLNDKFNHQKQATSYKHHLYHLFETEAYGGKNQHLYDSVVVLGRRLYSGRPAPVDEDTLYANIILLSNTQTDPHLILEQRKRKLYRSTRPAITASYEYSEKPMRDIAIITLQCIICKILTNLNHSDVVTEENLTELLQFQTGKSRYYEKRCDELLEKLPNDELLNLLPGNPNFAESFEKANEATYDALQAFIQKNHYVIIENEMMNNKDKQINLLKEMIYQQIFATSLQETTSGDAKNILKNVLDQAMNFPSQTELNAKDVIKLKMRKKIAKKIGDEVEIAFEDVVKQAMKCIQAFIEIQQEVSGVSLAKSSGNHLKLMDFYGEMADRFIANNDIMKRVFVISNSKTDILAVLYEILKTCFTKDPIYNSTYTEEIHARLGGIDVATATTDIVRELTQNLEHKIRFFSSSIFSLRTLEAYFINKDATDKNMIYDRLKAVDVISDDIYRTFYQTINGEKVESIWFYECSKENLLAGTRGGSNED